MTKKLILFTIFAFAVILIPKISFGASFSGTSIVAGDGNVYLDNTATWALVRNATSGTAQPTTDPVNVYGAYWGSYGIGRIFVPFNTSALGTGGYNVSIASATLQFNVSAVTNASTFHIVQTFQASSTTLVANDFDNLSFTSGGSSTISATGVKTIILNSTALSWISKTGTTYLGIIEDHDQSNTQPTANTNISINMSENATAGNRPTLLITYSTSSAATPTTNKMQVIWWE